MSVQERTLINGARREEISTFLAALQIAKGDGEGAKAYARLNPVSTSMRSATYYYYSWLTLEYIGMLQVWKKPTQRRECDVRQNVRWD
jgi:hypothetical protein